MKNLNNFVLATKDGETIMCESDDNRLENGIWEIQKGKFIKNKHEFSGKKVLGYFMTATNKYIVFTSRKVEKFR